jgi:GT2 family glycosyltransferase
MRILVAIPCLFNAEATRNAIQSVCNKPNVDLLLIDNGAPADVKHVIHYFRNLFANITFIHNPTNVFVNPAWNQAMNHFLQKPEYDYLIIMNSDLVMQKNWSEVCMKRWEVNPDDMLLPVIQESRILPESINVEYTEATEVFEGTPGVFISLTREQAHIVYPIPSEIKIWFGDNWIFSILRGLKTKTLIPKNLLSFHYWSQSVQRVEGISEMIENDKKQWETIVKPKLIEKLG